MQWLMGIVAAVIAGVIVFYITNQPKPTPTPRPPTYVPVPVTPSKPIYDPYRSFMTAATFNGSSNPMKDSRVQEAIKLTLRGEDLSKAKRFMMEAGWPDGFSLQLLMSQFKRTGGSDGEANNLINKLKKIGIRVHKVR